MYTETKCRSKPDSDILWDFSAARYICKLIVLQLPTISETTHHLLGNLKSSKERLNYIRRSAKAKEFKSTINKNKL